MSLLFCAKIGPVSMAEPENLDVRKELLCGAESDTKASTLVAAMVAERTKPNSILNTRVAAKKIAPPKSESRPSRKGRGV